MREDFRTTASPAFERGLRELGGIPRTSILIEYRYAEGKPERLPCLAVELIRFPVAVIVARLAPGRQGGAAGHSS